MSLAVKLGRLSLTNPILVASGTFGYAREMAHIVDFAKLGGIVPKTVTQQPRAGNRPPRTVETPSGMLNSIGLDNDGLEHFIAHHLPYLRELPAPTIVNIAGKTVDEFFQMTRILETQSGFAAVELNLSCPNVSGGIDFATDPKLTHQVVDGVRRITTRPVLAKLTPNITDIVPVAQAAADAGADAVCLVNTYVGMAVDWRRQAPILGNVFGGLSGPAIKPLVLRLVHRVAQNVDIPIIGIGGISNLDDAMEYLVTGATAVQIGTANFFDPTVSTRIVDQLPGALKQLGATSIMDIVGTLKPASQAEQLETHGAPASPQP